MKFAKTFDELIAWQKAKSLGILIYAKVPQKPDFDYFNQIKRAGLSISNNIAEGFGRNSHKEFKRFLMIALGSSNEVKSMILIGKDVGILEKKLAAELEDKTNEVIKIIIGLSNKLKL